MNPHSAPDRFVKAISSSCSSPILNFLTKTDVGKTAGPPVAVAGEEEAGSEVSVEDREGEE